MQQQKQYDRCCTKRDALNHPEGTFMFTLFVSKSEIEQK
jgi:hypothetical protein